MRPGEALQFEQRVRHYATQSRPAQRWPDMLTRELPAADIRPGTVLADERGDLVRVTAVGHGQDLVVLYVGPDDGTPHQVPNRRLRLRPTDPVRIPRTPPQGEPS